MWNQKCSKSTPNSNNIIHSNTCLRHLNDTLKTQRVFFFYPKVLIFSSIQCLSNETENN